MNIDPIQLLGVEPESHDRFRSTCLAGAGGRVFGGQVLAQALTAAAANLDARTRLPASIHGHFLGPGNVRVPMEYAVTTLKHGHSFVVRRVDARQADRIVTTATVTFHDPEEAPEHQSVMPIVPLPDHCRPFEPQKFGALSPAYDPVASRLAGFDETVPALQLWLRFLAPLGDDPTLRAAALVWLSDLALTRTVDLPRRDWSGFRQGASLDHTVWFHRPVDPDDWMLADHSSASYSGARGLACGHFYSQDGTLCATAVQECLIRRPASRP